MGLDAIIIADSGQDSFSGVSDLRLRLDGRTATIQVVFNYLENEGQVVPPIEGDGIMSWSSAPKLNGIYLFSKLREHGFNVALIDNYFQERDRFRDLLQDMPRAVIISTTFISSKRDLRILVDDIRSLASDVVIIAGGPLVHMSYALFQRSTEEQYEAEKAKDDYLFLDKENEPSVDHYIISLRGETILCEALKTLRQKRKIDNLPNSARLVGKVYRFTEQFDDISNAGETSVDWNSLPDAFFRAGVLPLQASNGCRYNCAFCNFTKDRRLSFIRPIGQLMTELKSVSSRGVRYVRFVDDDFRLGSGDLNAFCQRLIDEGVEIKWMSFIRASALKKVDVDLLQRSGCVEVQIGLESADPEVLRNMNKKANPRLYSEVIRKLLTVGINCSCCFLFGFPGETNETALRTREFIKSIEYPELKGVLTWSLFPFVLGPLSAIYESAMREKYELTGYMRDWKHRTMDYGQAMELIKGTFLELDNSGPIFRGDNLDSLKSLDPYQRKKFIAIRHRLSKLAMNGHLEKDYIIESFEEVLPQACSGGQP